MNKNWDQSCCFSIKTHAGTKKFRWFFVVSCCTPINQVQATVSEQIVQGVASFSAIMDVHDLRSNQSFCLTCSASQCHFQSEVIWFHRQVTILDSANKHCILQYCSCCTLWPEDIFAERYIISCPGSTPNFISEAPHSSQWVFISNMFRFMPTASCLSK